MSSNDSEMEEVVKDLRALLLASPKGVLLSRCQLEYADLTGKLIPYSTFGFQTLLDFLKSIPQAVSIMRAGPEYVLRYVADANTAHVAELVARSRPSTSAQARGVEAVLKRNRLHRISLPPTRSQSMYSMPSYRRGPRYQQMNSWSQSQLGNPQRGYYSFQRASQENIAPFPTPEKPPVSPQTTPPNLEQAEVLPPVPSPAPEVEEPETLSPVPTPTGEEPETSPEPSPEPSLTQEEPDTLSPEPLTQEEPAVLPSVPSPTSVPQPRPAMNIPPVLPTTYRFPLIHPTMHRMQQQPFSLTLTYQPHLASQPFRFPPMNDYRAAHSRNPWMQINTPSYQMVYQSAPSACSYVPPLQPHACVNMVHGPTYLPCLWPQPPQSPVHLSNYFKPPQPWEPPHTLPQTLGNLHAGGGPVDHTPPAIPALMRKNICAVLRAYPSGIPVSKFQDAFKSLHGYEFEPGGLGFKNLEDLLKSVDDVRIFITQVGLVVELKDNEDKVNVMRSAGTWPSGHSAPSSKTATAADVKETTPTNATATVSGDAGNGSQISSNIAMATPASVDKSEEVSLANPKGGGLANGMAAASTSMPTASLETASKPDRSASNKQRPAMPLYQAPRQRSITPTLPEDTTNSRRSKTPTLPEVTTNGRRSTTPTLPEVTTSSRLSATAVPFQPGSGYRGGKSTSSDGFATASSSEQEKDSTSSAKKPHYVDVLHQVLRENPKGLQIKNLMSEYERIAGEKLVLKEYKANNVHEFVRSFQSIFAYCSAIPGGDYILFDQMTGGVPDHLIPKVIIDRGEGPILNKKCVPESTKTAEKGKVQTLNNCRVPEQTTDEKSGHSAVNHFVPDLTFDEKRRLFYILKMFPDGLSINELESIHKKFSNKELRTGGNLQKLLESLSTEMVRLEDRPEGMLVFISKENQFLKPIATPAVKPVSPIRWPGQHLASVAPKVPVPDPVPNIPSPVVQPVAKPQVEAPAPSPAPKVYQLPKIEYPPDVVGAQEEYAVKKIPKVKTPQGQYFPVTFADIYTPWKFFLQLDEDKVAFAHLETNMIDFYGKDQSTKFKMTDQSYFPGHPCVALYEDIWQRAKFVSFENGKVTVTVVDFGGNVTVGPSKVRLLRRDFFDLAAQAIPSRLYGIMPANGAKKWSMNANNYFLEISKKYDPVVCWLQADNSQCEQISVCLYVTSVENDINLCDLLIEAKLAEVDYEIMKDADSSDEDSDDDSDDDSDESSDEDSGHDSPPGQKPVADGSPKVNDFMAKACDLLAAAPKVDDFVAKPCDLLAPAPKVDDFVAKPCDLLAAAPKVNDFMAKPCDLLAAAPKVNDFVSIPGDLLEEARKGNHTAQARVQKMIAQNVNHVMSAWGPEGANGVKGWDQSLPLPTAPGNVLPSPAPDPLLSSAQNVPPSAAWNGLPSAAQNLPQSASEAAKPSSWNMDLKAWATTAPQSIPPKRDQLPSTNQLQEAAVPPRSFFAPVVSAPSQAANRSSGQQPKLVLEQMQRKPESAPPPPAKTFSWAEVAAQPPQPAQQARHSADPVEELQCDLDDLDIGEPRFVKPVELLPGKVVHIVNMQESAYLVSTEVSAFFPEWKGQDLLYDMLGRRGFTVPHLDVDSKSFGLLFSDLLQYKVPGIINPFTGQPKKYLKLYKLNSVPQILQTFKCQDHNLWRAIHEQDVAFRSGDPYWCGL